MTTENGQALAKLDEERSVVAMGRHGVELQTLSDLWRFSKMVSMSGLAPKGLDKPEAIAVAIQMGLEVGLRPLQSLQNIAVINGRPTIWGDAAKALVEGSPACEWVNEGYSGEGDKTTAWCEAKRIGREPVRETFGVDDAKRAGLWGKSGPWKEYPRRMLRYRARGFALRDAFPDVLRGLYITEELQDVDMAPETRSHNGATARNRIIARAEEVREPEPETGEDTDTGARERLLATIELQGTTGAEFDAAAAGCGLGTDWESWTDAECAMVAAALEGGAGLGT